MTEGHLNQKSLIAGHVAVAALALATMRIAQPIVTTPLLHQAGQAGFVLNASPRRVPSPRRARRSIAIALLD
jgi:hypothetical protein